MLQSETQGQYLTGTFKFFGKTITYMNNLDSMWSMIRLFIVVLFFAKHDHQNVLWPSEI